MASVQQLPHLQSMVKRDPLAYKEDFMLQRTHFMNEVDIFRLRPLQSADRLLELLEFMSHTSTCYPEEAREFCNVVFGLLEKQADVLSPQMRLKLFQSLALTRSKSQSDPVLLLKLAFKLFTVRDRPFRVALSEYIFKEIKSQSTSRGNVAFVRELQAHLYKIISEDEAKVAQKCVEILNEVYRRKIWTDTRTVNIIVSACYHHDHKVQMAAVQFLLGIDSQMLEDEEDEKEAKKEAKTKIEVNKHEHSKKTKARKRDVERQQSKLKKMNRNGSEEQQVKPVFPALTLIHDPHKLADFLFKKCRNTGEKFEYKLFLMNLVSQLIGCHQLLLLGYYTFLQRYLTAHQSEVTKILAYFIQACHERVPPDELLPMVKNIAYQFVSERSTNEQVALGINCIREVFGRCPSILLEEDMADFIQDLAQYSRKSHKIVMAASRSLINVIRERYPALLKTKDRGRDSDKGAKPQAYGSLNPVTPEMLLRKQEKEAEEQDEWEEEEMDEDEEEDGSEGEWQSVGSGEEGEGEGQQGDEEGEWESVDEDSEEGEDGEEEEEEEEDGEDGWQEVSEGEEEGEQDEGDEDEDEEKEEIPLPAAGKRRRGGEKLRGRLDVDKVLGEEDLALIQKMQAHRKKSVQFDATVQGGDEEEGADQEEGSDEEGSGSDSGSGSDEDEDFNEALDFVFNPDNLMPSGRGEKATKVERLRSILSGREDRKFQSTHSGGLTNSEKKRKKNYVMVRRGKVSVHNKNRRASSEVRTHNAKRNEPFGRDRRKRRRT